MKNPLSIVFALLACLSICLSSCANRGTGCYVDSVKKIEIEDVQIVNTHAVEKEIELNAE